MDGAEDVCQIALVERHRKTGEVVNGFVSGFGYNKPCAVASTVAHDSHHMITIGTSKEDMALASNHLGRIGGGITVFSEGRELATVPLPIAGLMSDARAEIVADQAENGSACGPAVVILAHAAFPAGACRHPGVAHLISVLWMSHALRRCRLLSCDLSQ